MTNNNNKLGTKSRSSSNRRISSGDELNPFELAELYYGPKTDPSKTKPNSKNVAGRTRTLSAVMPKNFGNNFLSFTSFTGNNDDDSFIEGNTNSKINSNNNNESKFDFELGAPSEKFKKIKDSTITHSYTDYSNGLLTSSEDETDDLKEPHLHKDFNNNNDEESDFDDDEVDPLAGDHGISPYNSTSSFAISRANIEANLQDNNIIPTPKELTLPSDSDPNSNSNSSLNVNISSKSNPLTVGSRLRRRASADGVSTKNFKRFFISDIDATLKELLDREDTDQNCQITIEDTGPKFLKLGTANSNGFNQYDIRGTYRLSNLLQELTIAKRMGRKQMILDEARLTENPVERLKRLITTVFWKNLTRQVNEHTIIDMASDTKIDTPEAKFPRIYVPYNENDQFEFFNLISKSHPEYNLKIEKLPENITPEFVKSINHKPGLLSLAMKKNPEYIENGDSNNSNIPKLIGYEYIVPGGRFNEQYGWDSYMETLGLLTCDRIEPCIGMCENFTFEINNYGKILNANRSYYLCRSQPPFLTDMSLKCFNYLKEKKGIEDLDFLKRTFLAAIKEYYEIWCSEPRFDKLTGLSCYHPEGLGIPPETESSHFEAKLSKYAEKYNVSFEKFQELYNNGKINEPELDEYFLHDRAVRESGHDTSYRLEGKCGYLATIDLNSLLYKYECDIAFVIKNYFNNSLINHKNEIETSEDWELKSNKRLNAINKFCWNEKEGLFFDYNVKSKKQEHYESVTALWPLWCKLCTKDQAKLLIEKSLPKFEEFGGLVAGTLKSRGEIGLDRPSRQWDFPFGWAPHQILAWEGLKNYGYDEIAKRLSYRWCYLITLAFVDYNGIVVEKYNVTKMTDPHKVDAEYGNQGSDFKGVATEGFGWVNASYLLGLNNLDTLGIRALGLVTSPVDFFSKMNFKERKNYGLC